MYGGGEACRWWVAWRAAGVEGGRGRGGEGDTAAGPAVASRDRGALGVGALSGAVSGWRTRAPATSGATWPPSPPDAPVSLSKGHTDSRGGIRMRHFPPLQPGVPFPTRLARATCCTYTPRRRSLTHLDFFTLTFHSCRLAPRDRPVHVGPVPEQVPFTVGRPRPRGRPLRIGGLRARRAGGQRAGGSGGSAGGFHGAAAGGDGVVCRWVRVAAWGGTAVLCGRGTLGFAGRWAGGIGGAARPGASAGAGASTLMALVGGARTARAGARSLLVLVPTGPQLRCAVRCVSLRCVLCFSPPPQAPSSSAALWA